MAIRTMAEIEAESADAAERLKALFGQCASAEGIHLWNRASARCERCGAPYPYIYTGTTGERG